MPSTLRMRIAAPLQSWGTRSRFTNRDTEREPTKSGIIGLVCAALGRSRDSELNDLTGLRFGVRIDAPGRIERDFQTAGNVPNTEGKNPRTVISDRYYLADATFLVALDGDQELLESIDDALWSPTWPLFLGRKSYVPTPPLSLGVSGVDLESVLNTTPWQTRNERLRAEARRRLDNNESENLLAVIDADSATGDDTRNDVPVSFADRRFTTRYIKRIAVPMTAELIGDEPHQQELRRS